MAHDRSEMEVHFAFKLPKQAVHVVERDLGGRPVVEESSSVHIIPCREEVVTLSASDPPLHVTAEPELLHDSREGDIDPDHFREDPVAEPSQPPETVKRQSVELLHCVGHGRSSLTRGIVTLHRP